MSFRLTTSGLKFTWIGGSGDTMNPGAPAAAAQTADKVPAKSGDVVILRGAQNKYRATYRDTQFGNRIRNDATATGQLQ